MTELLKDPSLDIRGEIAEKSGVLDPLDKIWFHKTAGAVIDADRCVRCGSCVAACPSRSLGIDEEGNPTLLRMCTGCSNCWDFCPLAGLRTERLTTLWEGEGPAPTPLGRLMAAYRARAFAPAPESQDGGVATALLEALLEARSVDGVIVATRSGPQRGKAAVARTPEEVRAAAGSRYDQTLPLAHLDAAGEIGCKSLAMVGTPCQIAGLRALQRYGWGDRKVAANRVVVTIALFCTRSFDGQKLLLKLLRSGVNPRQMKKLDIRDGVLTVYGEKGESVFSRPVNEFRDSALRGCDECADFSGRLADISLGNVGSPAGFTSVLVRTPVGEAAWNAAAPRMLVEPLGDLAEVQRLERNNRRRAVRNLQRPYDPEGFLWVTYSEHLGAYLGTEREPKKSPPHRSHHYTTAC
ncbi:MAG: Coenzyme F420 hydrogenase/dehydrogenase, beta subunit C-terminal domain [Chloroflexi bacterium]|nr:Coenzyme F420 hydrogenase/dehydrogenase, beta subunit C-terminal domain [Chloroflexota bacterium]